MSNTIVFIHGAWLTRLSWENLIVAFAALDPHHATRVNFKNNNRAPLLLIASENDHLVPAHVVKTNYEHHKESAARTDFHEFAGRAHLLTAQAGWEEVADFVAGWLAALPTNAARAAGA